MANFTPVGVEATIKGLGPFTRGLDKMRTDITKTGKATEGVGKQFLGLGKNVLGVGAKMAKVAAGGIALATTALIGLTTISVKAAISFESAFAGVIKTTDGLVDEMGELTKVGEEVKLGFRDLSKEVPVAIEELLGIGEIAGQLGIGQEALIDFTRTIADLGVATDLTTEEAAFALARVSNIFNIETENMGDNVRSLGNAIVALGNNFAATEPEIAAYSLRIAAAGRVSGLTQGDILGIGAAMSAVGVPAERGGTAVQKVLFAMNAASAVSEQGFIDHTEAIEKNGEKLLDLTAKLVTLESQTGVTGQSLMDQFDAFVAAGGAAADFGRELGDTQRAQLFKTIRSIKDLTEETNLLQEQQGKPISDEMLSTFARLSGRTEEQFRKDWKEDAAAVFRDFVKGLGEEGDKAEGVLEALELGDSRLISSFLSLTGAQGQLTDAMKLANAEFEDGTALAEEAEKRYRTTESQILLLKNQLKDLAITIGDAVLPFINELIQAARPLIEELGKRLPGAIEAVISKIRELIGAFKAGGVGGLASALGFSDETIALIQGIGQRIVSVIQFVQENWEAFKGALIGIGAVLASAGIAAAIVGIAGAIAALFNPITLIIIAAAALGAAWQTNFLGIRDILTAFWENTARPIFEQLIQWLQINIPVAISILADFWQTTLLPAIQVALNFIRESVIPVLSQLVDWFMVNLPVAIQFVVGQWNALVTFLSGTLIPAISQVITWFQENLPIAIGASASFITDTLIPIFQTVSTWLSENIPLAIQAASSFFTERLIPAIQMLVEFFAPSIQRLVEGFQGFIEAIAPALPQLQELIPIVSTIAEIIGGILLFAIRSVIDAMAFLLPFFGELLANAITLAVGVITGFAEFISGVVNVIVGLFTGDMTVALQGVEQIFVGLGQTIMAVFGGIQGQVETVLGVIEKLATDVLKIKLPAFLTPGSPTPFEVGLVGIAGALTSVVTAALQAFSAQALAVFTQVRILVQGLDAVLTLIWEVTLPQLQITTQATADQMVISFNQVAEAISQVNSLLSQMISLLQEAASAAADTAKAMVEGFEEAADAIEDELIDALEELRDILEDVKTEAEAAAKAVNDIGRGTPTAGAGVGPGFQAGADFIVPPGFSDDRFQMRVSSGERVIVVPREEVGADGAGGGIGNEFNLTVQTVAAPSAIIQQFEVMQALVS